MPRFTVNISRTLTLTTSISMTAKNENAAHDAVTIAIEGSAFGTIAWEVEDCKAKIDGWEEEDEQITIASIGEE